MPDVFISYCTADDQFARFLHRHLTAEGLSVFLASVSLRAGQTWGDTILDQLREADWIIFLASRAACRSAYVQQEMGGAVLSKKKVFPIVWDMSPSELPGWTSKFQAINLCGASPEQISDRITAMSGQIKSEKQKGQLVAALLVGGLLLLANSK